MPKPLLRILQHSEKCYLEYLNNKRNFLLNSSYPFLAICSCTSPPSGLQMAVVHNTTYATILNVTVLVSVLIGYFVGLNDNIGKPFISPHHILGASDGRSEMIAV